MNKVLYSYGNWKQKSGKRGYQRYVMCGNIAASSTSTPALYEKRKSGVQAPGFEPRSSG